MVKMLVIPDNTPYFSEPEGSNVSVIYIYNDECLEGNKPDINITNYGNINAPIKLFKFFGGNSNNPISITELNKINKNSDIKKNSYFRL